MSVCQMDKANQTRQDVHTCDTYHEIGDISLDNSPLYSVPHFFVFPVNSLVNVKIFNNFVDKWNFGHLFIWYFDHNFGVDNFLQFMFKFPEFAFQNTVYRLTIWVKPIFREKSEYFWCAPHWIDSNYIINFDEPYRFSLQSFIKIT